MSEFLQRVEGEIQNRHLISRGQKILVAVSGGVDSMVLLHALNQLAEKYRWQILVAHFNHQLRGRASKADEKLVQNTARKLGLKFFSGGEDVKEFSARSKISVEMAARKLRHEFIARIAQAQGVSTVALAHHADDQVELFFLRVLRGAGAEGIAGMKWISPSPVLKSVRLIRPLLALTKNELQDFARVEKISFRNDASNLSADFLRNRIRNELLPLLEKKYQPGLAKTVLRTMEIVGAESSFVNSAALAWSIKPEQQFESLPVAIQRKVLHRKLIKNEIAAGFDLIEQLRSSAGKWVSVGASMSVMRDIAGDVHRRGDSMLVNFNDEAVPVVLRGGAGRGEFAGRNFEWQVIVQKSNSLPKPEPGAEVFDADLIGSEIILRHWRAGDRFQPIGMKSPVKLQDLFVNAKIPASIRRELILATTSSGEIFWVEGLRIGENFKLKPQARRWFEGGIGQKTPVNSLYRPDVNNYSLALI